jgi:glycosyltransferase involved in cell wall biosynthesis
MTIESVLNQSIVSDIKLIIVDDKSNQNIKQIVNSIDKQGIIFKRNNSKLGMTQNWNRCISLAKTPYLVILHDDDVLHPKAIEYLLNLIEENEKLAVVASRQKIITGKLKPEFLKLDLANLSSLVYKPLDIAKFVKKEYSYLPCSSAMFRLQCFKKTGRFDIKYKYSPDEELWPRILYKGYSIGIIEYPLVYVRRKNNNFIYSTWEKQEFIKQYIGIHQKILSYTGNDEEVMKSLDQKLARAFIHLAFFHLIRKLSIVKSLEYFRIVNFIPRSRKITTQMSLIIKFWVLSFIDSLFSKIFFK